MIAEKVFFQARVHRVGGVERAALVAGVSASSISMYQRHQERRLAPRPVVTALDAYIASLPLIDLSEAIRRAHKEGNEAIQAAMDLECISCLEKEIMEDIAEKLNLLQCVRGMRA